MKFDFDKKSRVVVCSVCRNSMTFVLRVHEERLKELNNDGGMVVAECCYCDEPIDMQEILGKVAKLVVHHEPPPPIKEPQSMRAKG